MQKNSIFNFNLNKKKQFILLIAKYIYFCVFKIHQIQMLAENILCLFNYNKTHHNSVCNFSTNYKSVAKNFQSI